jgi:2-dehydropantoate 2-reductase
MTRRYIVVGAGAVGTALAAGLAEAGIEVILVSRGATYEAIRAKGLRLTHRGVTRTLEVPVVAGPEEVDLRHGDILVLAVKTQDAADALARWAARSVVTDAGPVPAGFALPVLALQNGLEAERAALRHFATVVSGTTLVAAVHTVPGEVTVYNGPLVGHIIVGPAVSGVEAEVATQLSASIAADFASAGWWTEAVTTPERFKAWKLVQSSAFAVAVLAGSDREKDDLSARVREETAAVLRAAGLTLADPETELVGDRSQAGIDPNSGYIRGQLSTWQSFERGSGSEVDYLNGEAVLTARLLGRRAPLNEALQAVLAASAAAHEPPGTRSVVDVLAIVASFSGVKEATEVAA